MTEPVAIGIDTSSYTTSVAAVTFGRIAFEKRAVLFVRPGERGLRQSEAVFQHVKNLPALVDALFDAIDAKKVSAVAVSASPTEQEGSYMPVFLPGVAVAGSIASALSVPLISSTHQRGHLRAALLGNEQLLDKPRFLAFHLSGGTTDALDVRMENGTFSSVLPIGSSKDLHVGQLVDRVGVKFGLPFPAGKHLEQLASTANKHHVKIPSSVNGLDCSFSGAETCALSALERGETPDEVAYGVYDCIARTLQKLIDHAVKKTGVTDVLLCGGVASSALLGGMLKAKCSGRLYFGESALSSDNACGTALIGLREAQ